MNDINMELLRRTSKKAMQTHFQQGWQFRVDMDETPDDWDLYCKEISQQAWNIETNTFKAGGSLISYPDKSNPITLSLTLRDNEDGRIWQWFDRRSQKVSNSDGTWNLPVDYLLNCKIYRRMSDGSEVLRQKLKLLPLTLGEITESLDGGNGLLEFPITFVEFRTGNTAY